MLDAGSSGADPVARRPHVVGRRPVRARRPPALERQAIRRHPPRGRRLGERPFGRPPTTGSGSRSPTSTRSRRARRSAGAQRRGLCRQSWWRSFGRRASRRPTAGRSSTSSLLGVGSDGHILSVFPGSAAFDSKRWALAIPAPTHIEPHVERVTLNPAVVAVAERVLVVAYGAGKADDRRPHLRAERRSAPRSPRSWRCATARPGSSTRRPRRDLPR